MSQGVSKVTPSAFPPGSMCVLTVSALSFPESECVPIKNRSVQDAT